MTEAQRKRRQRQRERNGEVLIQLLVKRDRAVKALLADGWLEARYAHDPVAVATALANVIGPYCRALEPAGAEPPKPRKPRRLKSKVDAKAPESKVVSTKVGRTRPQPQPNRELAPV